MVQTISEGWADYVGHTFAFMKHGIPFSFNEFNWRDGVWNMNRNYLQHLENNPTYFNSFIPRGLFYDLTDGGSNGIFYQIQGFTI